MTRYIYQFDQWPNFTWDDKEIQVIFGKVRHLQGKIFGQMGALGFSLKEETMLSTLTLDVLKSSEIEGAISGKPVSFESRSHWFQCGYCPQTDQLYW